MMLAQTQQPSVHHNLSCNGVYTWCWRKR